jgi:diguanylate cyclase (GGDEF)-like protein
MKRGKLQIIAVFFIIILTAIPISLLYQQTKDTIVREAGKEARDIAITVAAFIEHNVEPYKALSSVEHYDLEEYDQQYYKDMLQLFQRLRFETGADFIFTEKFVSPDSIAYILDGEQEDSEKFSPIGSLDTMSGPERDAFEKATPMATKLLHDPVWGYYITGFAPIQDPQTNEVIGLVGVDYSIAYLSGILGKLHTIVIVVFSLVVIILSLLFLFASNAYYKRLNLDYLTGLYNRKYFEEQLQQMIRKTKGKPKPFSIMIIDVDNFKQINDQHGHETGDIALKKVAHFLSAHLKEHDLAFRYGGDEFAAILPDSTKEKATFISRRLNTELSSSVITVDQERTIRVCVSIGLAEYVNGMNAATLIHEADQEMYQVKFSKLKKIK